MLITERFTIANTKRFLSNQNLFEILYHAFVREIKFRKKRKGKLFDSGRQELVYTLRNAGSEKYKKCRTIMLSNMIFDFLDWKPYIKTFNYVAIANFIQKKCRSQWDLFHYTKKRTMFDSTDHKIRTLYGLWEKGIYFKDFDHIPKAIKKLMSLELYGAYFLQRLFDRDFQQGKMQYFSTSRKETVPYYRSYYYPRSGRLRSYEDIELDTTLYEPQDPETLHTQFTINVDTSDGTGSTIPYESTTGSYAIYQSNTSANTATGYYDSQGGTVTWRITGN